jgi:hypothetical protein
MFCSLLCCSLGGASALVTLNCVLCTLRTQISQSICNFTHYSIYVLSATRDYYHIGVGNARVFMRRSYKLVLHASLCLPFS